MGRYKVHWECNMTQTIDGEYYPTAGYNASHQEGQYHYHFDIMPFYKTWKVWGYLNLQTYCSNDVKLFAKEFRLLKECKQFVDDYVSANPDFMDKVEQWKADHIKPAFDKDFNFLGNYYSSPSHLTKEYDYKMWDWYSNDTVPLDKRYSVRYTLDKMYDWVEDKATPIITIWNIHFGGHSAKCNDDKELIDKLMSNLDKVKYKRFFEGIEDAKRETIYN